MPRRDLDNVMGANFAVMVVVKSSCGMIVSLFEWCAGWSFLRVFEWWIDCYLCVFERAFVGCCCALRLCIHVVVECLGP